MKTSKIHISTAWTIVAMFAAIVVLGSLSFAGHAFANPFYTGSKAQSAAATSTQLYMRQGLATSTTVYDSYEQNGTNQSNTGNLTLPDSVAIVLDGVASSSASVINLTCEYSDNNSDWYQNEVFTTMFATSSNPVYIQTPASYTFIFASSTVGGAGLSGTNTRFQKLTTCPVPTRYVRAIVSNTGANASVWVQFIPKKQRNSGN